MAVKAGRLLNSQQRQTEKTTQFLRTAPATITIIAIIRPITQFSQKKYRICSATEGSKALTQES
uniref:PRA1 family protein A1-like n=1 Tax=Rhizophora mucronata TaxID=61149 RepID=A0A2P2LN02_RHIMU